MDDLSVPPETRQSSTSDVDDPALSAPAQGGAVEAVTPEASAVEPAKAPVDLSVLEKIEAELAAVEQALVKIDEGVYDGFEGIEDVSAPSAAG